MITRALREFAEKHVLGRKKKSNNAVGYKKPPKQHRFKKGNSGGPGRPKKKVDLPGLIESELLKEDAALAKQLAAALVTSAAYGSFRAAHIVINLTKDK